MNLKKLSVILTLALACAPLANAEVTVGSKLIGGWDLREFTYTGQDGVAVPFCPDSYGKLIYERSGNLSVAINCRGSIPQDAPAQAYGGMLFYTGDFTIQGNTVLHHITNASLASMIGQTNPREVKQLDEQTLVLEGISSGKLLTIKWSRSVLPASFAGMSGTYEILRPDCSSFLLSQGHTAVVTADSLNFNVGVVFQNMPSPNNIAKIFDFEVGTKRVNCLTDSCFSTFTGTYAPGGNQFNEVVAHAELSDATLVVQHQTNFTLTGDVLKIVNDGQECIFKKVSP